MILASQSPRRAELLRLITSAFRVIPADVDETALPGEHPHQYVERLARRKAQVVAEQHPADPVLGADTIVVLGDRMMGKPINEADGLHMLQQLSGQAHSVLTGIALVQGGITRSTVVETRVRLRAMTPLEIKRYWDSGEPADKAGGYAIQGLAARFVIAIEGSYTNVVGLPLVETEALLAHAS